MPALYLSPSTQENNLYVNGGTEEEWMNRLADEMVPYLTACGIRTTRNTPEMTAGSSIRGSNAGQYDLHLALHSNAAPEGRYGQYRGILAFYYPTSSKGRRAALLTANGLKAIYPLPNLVEARGTTAIGEVRRVRAPSVFLEIGYHDNAEDAVWIQDNLGAIARNIVLSLTEYFSLPFLTPAPARPGTAELSWGTLNLRDRPTITSPILAQIFDGTKLLILNQWEDWTVIKVNSLIGWANSKYIKFS